MAVGTEGINKGTHDSIENDCGEGTPQSVMVSLVLTSPLW